MANFLKWMFVVQERPRRVRTGRPNLLVFGTLTAALAVLSVFHTATQAELSADQPPATVAESPAVTAPEAAEPVPAPQPKRYRALAEYLAKRYLVSTEAIQEMVAAAHHAGERVGLDPLLIIAVMAVESRFNPIAESGAGAKGLMQVIPKYHLDKLEPWGGEKAVLDPPTNILVGAMILREYMDRTGDLTAALQRYNGAPQDTETGYTRKVVNERQRLNQVVAQTRA